MTLKCVNVTRYTGSNHNQFQFTVVLNSLPLLHIYIHSTRRKNRNDGSLQLL